MEQAVLMTKGENTNERVLKILFDSDEVTWKALIFGLIETEQMNPWDIDLSIIAQKFLVMLKELQQLDFRISGKIVLASAILLKLKSDKLMDEEIAALDQLINSVDEPADMSFFEEFPVAYPGVELLGGAREKPQLVPRTPQPRKRKVSVYDLVEALEHALEIEHNRPPKFRSTYKKVEVPTDHVDITEVIKDVYMRINGHYAEFPGRKEKLTFSEIIPSESKEDKVMTFIPLLHLDNQRKVDLLQEEHFGEIEIDLLVKDADLGELAMAAEAAQS